jgi:hypothetical protein
VCKVGYVGNVCAIMCRRARKTVVEVWSHDPPEVAIGGSLVTFGDEGAHFWTLEHVGILVYCNYIGSWSWS